MNEPKEYLNRIRLIESRIRNLELTIEKTRADMTGVRAIVYDKDKVQTSPNADGMADIMARIDELEHRLSDELTRLQTERATIVLQINQLTDPRHIEVLTMRYVQGMTWHAIYRALQKSGMPYEERQIYNIHGQALRAFGKIIAVNCSNE